MIGGLVARLRSAERAIAKNNQEGSSGPQFAPGKDPGAYAADPVGYVTNILGSTLTPDQEEILKALLVPPFKVLVPSAHDVGKTYVAACAVNWWYDSFNPGVVLSTAPTQRDVVDLLWTEVRLQRIRAGLPMSFAGPSAPLMSTGPDHYAKGFTARKGESFQGRHRHRMLFVFDEANGIDQIYWLTFRTMFDPTMGHAALFIFNPTDTTSQAYAEDNLIDESKDPPYHRFRLSALNHPNVLAELAGKPKPIPGAVGLAMIDEWVRDWCEPVAKDDAESTDVEWPPSSGTFYRPGPIFQARAMGLWPSSGAGVWSDALWTAALTRPLPANWPVDALPQIGCDTATGKGEDFHAIHTRWGAVSLFHETANTMDPRRICQRLKAAAKAAADFATQNRDPGRKPIEATEIAIKIDDDGTGNAVAAFLRAEGYNVHPVGAGTRATREDRYPRKRDELWFEVADRAKCGQLCIGRLDKPTLRRLKQQLMAPAWDLDAAGRRCVEPKEDTKEKIGRSPDDADAFNLSYHEPTSMIPHAVEPDVIKRAGGHFGRGR